MNWFQHDTDATQDAKLKKLLIRQGAIGYAVYFHCLELVASDISESNLTFELEHDSEIIASNLFIKGTAEKSGIEIVESVMRDIIDIGLFSESNGRVFCIKLLKRISLSMTSSPSFRTAINSKKDEYHDTVMTHHDIVTTRHETLPTLPTLPTNITEEKSAPKVATPPKETRFRKPTVEEVETYCLERRNSINPEQFVNYYDSKGWRIGNAGMKDWKAAVRTWEANEKKYGNKPAEAGYKFDPKDYKDI